MHFFVVRVADGVIVKETVFAAPNWMFAHMKAEATFRGTDWHVLWPNKEPCGDVVVGYLPLGGCGAGPSGTDVLCPPRRRFSSVSEAKAAPVPEGFVPWIAEPAGFHTRAFGQWQFTACRSP
jgi:hypothetical protein